MIPGGCLWEITKTNSRPSPNMDPVKKKNLHVWITASDGAALKLSTYDVAWTFSEKKAMPTRCTIDPFRCSSRPCKAQVLGKTNPPNWTWTRERKTRIELQLLKQIAEKENFQQRSRQCVSYILKLLALEPSRLILGSWRRPGYPPWPRHKTGDRSALLLWQIPEPYSTFWGFVDLTLFFFLSRFFHYDMTPEPCDNGL